MYGVMACETEVVYRRHRIGIGGADERRWLVAAARLVARWPIAASPRLIVLAADFARAGGLATFPPSRLSGKKSASL